MARSFKWPASGVLRQKVSSSKMRLPPEGSERRDYENHIWTLRETIILAVQCACLVIVLCWFFYRSVWACLPLSVLGIRYGKNQRVRKAQEDRRNLLLQFCDMIQSAASAMKAGYSVENAFLESYVDMCMMYGESSMICQELNVLRRGLIMNIALEELLTDFGQRSHVPQIREFASVFSIARKSGGNMAEIIRSTADVIHRLVETREEIQTQTAARRMERNIMNVMPFAILAYVDAGNKGYFDTLYHNLTGVAIMTVCLVVYLAAYFLSEQILDKALDVLK